MEKREIRFNAWLPELGFMLEDVAVGHGSVSFPFIDEPEDEFYQFLKSKGYINGDEENLPDYLYANEDDWCCITDDKHFHLLQFTGLHDKNNKPIFEGSILISESGQNTVVVECGVRNVNIKGFPNSVDDRFEMHGWVVRNLKNNLVGELDSSFYGGEVIGNIFQYAAEA